MSSSTLQGPGPQTTAPWHSLLLSTLRSWHQPEKVAEEDLQGPAMAFARGLLSCNGERPAVLAALRRQLAELPLADIHGSWLAASLPSDPLMRRSCLELMPGEARRRAARELPRVREARAQPALPLSAGEQLRPWWNKHLHRSLSWPRPLPWHRQAEQPLTVLDRLPPDEIVSLLERFGLRALALGLRGLPRRQAGNLVFSLAPSVRDTLVYWSRRSAKDPADAWAQLLCGLLERRPAASGEAAHGTPGYGSQGEVVDAQLLLDLALRDLAVQARALGLEDDIRRLALKLARPLGLELISHLEELGLDSAEATTRASEARREDEASRAREAQSEHETQGKDKNAEDAPGAEDGLELAGTEARMLTPCLTVADPVAWHADLLHAARQAEAEGAIDYRAASEEGQA